MERQAHLMLTAEEHELIQLWLERSPERRTLGHVPEFTDWVVARRPDLLPKGSDDACEYLARLLADAIQDNDGESRREEPARR